MWYGGGVAPRLPLNPNFRAALAERTGQTRQNLSNKFKRNNFTESELHAIAVALGCRCEITFITSDGERL